MIRLLPLLALAVCAIAPTAALAAPAGTLELISRPSGLAPLPAPQANNVESLSQQAMSEDGCRIVFISRADGLAPDDEDDSSGVFVRDRCAAGGPATTLVSRADGPNGEPANSGSSAPVISRDGTVVAFESHATNLDPAANAIGRKQVFVRVLASHDTQLVSRAATANGAAGGGDSANPALDADGSVVAFDTAATNIAGTDTNAKRDIVIRDRTTHATGLVSRNTSGEPANGDSTEPSLNATGTKVAFRTAATDLGSTDTNNHADIAVRTIESGATVLASRADTPGDPLGDNFSMRPMLSADGTRVVFTSRAKNLPGGSVFVDFQVWVRDLTTDTTIQVSVGAATSNDTTSNGSISADGTKVAFASRTAAYGVGGPGNDVFVRDLTAQTTTLASRASGAAGAVGTGHSGSPALSADGAHAAFHTTNDTLLHDDADDFSAIAERDLVAPNATRLVSVPSGNATLNGATNESGVQPGGVSADGRYVVFTSSSDGLAESRFRQVFVRDTRTDTTTLVSATPSGAPGNGDSTVPVISDDGARIAYVSTATDIAPGHPGGGYEHVFVATRGSGGTFTTVIASRNDADAVLPNGGYEPAISGDGGRVAFGAWDAAAPGDADNQQDVVVRDLAAGTTTLASPGTTGYVDRPQLDRDGSRVLFRTSQGLTGGDTNGEHDFYVRDLAAGTTLLASANAAGTAVGGSIQDGSLNADGRYVAFASSATNVSGDADGFGGTKLFRKDLDSGAVVLVSREDGSGPLTTSPGGHAPAMSADGSRIAFASGWSSLDPADDDAAVDIYLRDIESAQTRLVSRAVDGTNPAIDAFEPAISADGRCVAFQTRADMGDGYPGGDFAQVHMRATGGECLDESAPTTTVGQLEGGKIAFSSDAGATFECSLDGGAFAPCTSPYDTAGVAAGEHTLAVRATDAAGNVESPAKQRAFSIAAQRRDDGGDTAVPGPGPGPGDAPARQDPQPPAPRAATIALAGARLRLLSRGAALGVPVRCEAGPCTGTITLKLRGKRLARTRFSAASGTSSLRVALSKVSSKRLKRAGKAKVAVELALDGAAAVKASLRVR